MAEYNKLEEKVNALELQLQDVHEIIYVLGMALCDATAGACEFSHQPLPDIVVETKNKLNKKFSESKNTTPHEPLFKKVELKTLVVDVDNHVFLINGKDFGPICRSFDIHGEPFNFTAELCTDHVFSTEKVKDA